MGSAAAVLRKRHHNKSPQNEHSEIKLRFEAEAST
jgi:hypothetical protein